MSIDEAKALIPAGSHKEMDQLLNIDLTPDSLVVVLGSFTGLTAHIIYAAHGCKLICFDPQMDANRKLRERVPSAKVFDFALGNRTGTFEMWGVGNAGASFHKKSRPYSQMVEVRDVKDSLNDLDIDLLFLNIEGGEYEVFDRLYETSIIKNIRRIMIQFHILDDQPRYLAYRDRLNEDYSIIWSMGSTWTLFERGIKPVEKVEDDNNEERVPCDSCGYLPKLEKDYGRSMNAHMRKHAKDKS